MPQCYPFGTLVLILLWSYSSPSSAGGLVPASIDLPKVTKLRDAVFRPEPWTVTWIVMAPQNHHI